jgi:hypothetical protein
LELIWLTGRLAPDFKTIADFRRDRGLIQDLASSQLATRAINRDQERWQTVRTVHIADQALCMLKRDAAARHIERPLAPAPQDLCLSRRPGEAALSHTYDRHLLMKRRKESRAKAGTLIHA